MSAASNRGRTETQLQEHGVPVRLPAGSLVVEKYYYATDKQTTGVQWLAHKVDPDGNLSMIRACRSRKEALEVLSRV